MTKKQKQDRKRMLMLSKCSAKSAIYERDAAEHIREFNAELNQRQIEHLRVSE